VILALVVLGLLATVAACEKTNEVPVAEGPLEAVEFTYEDGIPAEYGRLVAVTTTTKYPAWAQLWFEKPDSSIALVILNFHSGEVRNKILEIPRT
jgi:hypothetical protein